MSRLKLELPVIQNWSCHNCGGCCRQHLIEVTDAERQLILAQNWTSNDGIELPVMKWHAGPPWKKRYRLAHQSDGGCVFLDEKGLCRIHAKFGEAAKPLACRIYPYAFHPSGKSYAVSLRYSCPSVVANLGTAVSEQTAELRRLAEGVIPERREHRAPRLTERSQVEWSDFLPFVEALDHTMIDPTAPLSLRLARAVTWTTLVGQSAFESLKGQRIREFIGLLMEAARSEWSTVPAEPGEPDRVTRVYFRTLVAQYARKDTAADLSSGIAGRWRLFRSILKLSLIHISEPTRRS